MNTLLASVGRTLIESARSLPNLYRCGLSATPACNGHTFPQFANLPVSKLTGGKNNVYETRVDRKRVIRDPNLPDFEKIEKLDWATWGMLRDVRRRHLFVRYIEDRNCYKNLRRCKTLPNAIREVAHEEEEKLPRDSKFVHMNSRCAITGRSRGVLKRYRLSRLVWRNQADYNKLSGVIKASW